MATNRLAPELPELSGCMWSFAGRTFDESRLELRVGGEAVDLELKPLEVLLYLLRHAGEVVSKSELLDAVWPGLNVVEGSLSTAVYKLRKALGDDDSSIVITVPRVGYRLAAVAHAEASRPSPSPLKAKLVAGSPVPGREQWLLLRPLDTSSGSEVWLAEHPKTHELRVFKFVSKLTRLRTLKREVTVFRFLRESLEDRRHLVQILEWNFETEPYFLESEYGGLNLAAWAEDQGGLPSIPLQRRLHVLAEISRAVSDVHAVGVLHKDLKPANVLVARLADGEERIKIADFGSALLLEPSRLEALGITRLGLDADCGPRIKLIQRNAAVSRTRGFLRQTRDRTVGCLRPRRHAVPDSGGRLPQAALARLGGRSCRPVVARGHCRSRLRRPRAPPS